MWMRKLFQVFILILTVAFIGSCGVSNKSSTGVNESSAPPANTRTISGYVIDDPVVGATIEVYDKDGNLLARKENATNAKGYFRISLPREMNSSMIIKVVAKNGFINGKYYEFTLSKYISLNDSSDDNIVITPFTTIVSNLIESIRFNVESRDITNFRQMVKESLGINDLESVPKEFSSYLQNKGDINHAIEKITQGILQSSMPDEELAKVFPNSKIFKTILSLEIKSSIIDSDNITVVTNNNEGDSINNTSSLVDAAVVDENNEVIALPTNIPSLKGKIDEKTTAFSIIALGLKDVFGVSNLQLERIYEAIKDKEEYKNFVNIVANAIEKQTPLSSILQNEEVLAKLESVYKLILNEGLIDIPTETNETSKISREDTDRITRAFLKGNVEWFSYPAFTFQFSGATNSTFTGNVEFTATNPSYIGYGFLPKDIFFSEEVNWLEKNFSTLFIPGAKPLGKIPKFSEIFNFKKDVTTKTLGKSEKWSYNLHPFNCIDEDCIDPRCKSPGMCWKGDFIAYDYLGFNKPTIYNAFNLMKEISSLIPSGAINNDSVNKVLEKLQSYYKKTDDIKELIAFIYEALKLSANIAELTINLSSDLTGLVSDNVSSSLSISSDMVHQFLVKLESNEKEIQKALKVIGAIIKKFNIDKPKNRDYCSNITNLPEFQSLENQITLSLSTGDPFLTLNLLRTYSGSEIIGTIICKLLTPPILVDNKEYSFDEFFKDPNISKFKKTITLMYHISNVFHLDKVIGKDTVITLKNLMKVQGVQIKYDPNFKSSDIKNLASMVDSLNNLLEIFNSWENRGFYINTKKLKENMQRLGEFLLEDILAEWASSFSDEYVKKKIETILKIENIKKLSSAELRKALVSLQVAKVAVNSSYMIASYIANPQLLPYQIIAIKGDDGNVEFKADTSLKSIGYSKSYILDAKGIISVVEDQFHTPLFILAKDTFEFNPSMQLIFPKGVLSEYFEKTLFMIYGYPYAFKLWITDNISNKSTLALGIGVASKEEYEEPNWVEVIYSYWFGNNDAYVNKAKAPEVLIRNIRILEPYNYEYLDAYDVIHSNDPAIKFFSNASNSGFVKIQNKKVHLYKPGFYRIRMQTTIDQPYTSYINQNKVALNTWNYVTNVVILKSLDIPTIKALTNYYTFKSYINANGIPYFEIVFPDLLCNTLDNPFVEAFQNPWESQSVDTTGQISQYSCNDEYVIFPYIDGVLYAPTDNNFKVYTFQKALTENTKYYVYILSKDNLELLEVSETEITPKLLDLLVKEGIAFKKEIIPTNTNQPTILTFSLSNPYECTSIGNCTFVVDIEGEITNYLIDFGDGNQEENTATSLSSFKHTYEQSGNYTVTLKVCNDELCDEESIKVDVKISEISNVEISKGLIAYYSFDNCDARDDSGNGHDGEVISSPKCETGVKGNAFNFNGKDQYISIPYSPAFNLENYEGFTIALWAKAEETNGVYSVDFYDTSNGVPTLISKDCSGDPTGPYNLYMKSCDHQNSTQCISFEIQNNNNIIEEKDFSWPTTTAGEFHFIVWRHYDNVYELWIDGKKRLQVHSPLEPSSGERCLLIGRRGWSNGYFKGAIDEIRIYNRALTENEILELYKLGNTSTTRDGAGEYIGESSNVKH